MDWSGHLELGETIQWQGRPAPRCYVFRNWRRSVFGFFLLLLSVLVQVVCYKEGGLSCTFWLPLPFLLLGLYLTLGHLILARLQWEHLFYMLTDRRILVVQGLLRRRFLSLPLAELTGFHFYPHGEHLGSLQLRADKSGRTLQLSCLEHPRLFSDRLEAMLLANGQKVPISSASF